MNTRLIGIATGVVTLAALFVFCFIRSIQGRGDDAETGAMIALSFVLWPLTLAAAITSFNEFRRQNLSSEQRPHRRDEV